VPIRGARTLTWRPRGLVDAIDGTNARPGDMASLANLIPDSSTRGIFVPRPASIQFANSAPTTGGVTVFLILGSWLYGMCTSGAYDVPFAYNLATQALVYPVSGARPGFNCPLAQSTVGDWTPPQMATCSTYVLLTHPGFTGPGNGYIGWMNILNPAEPVWSSGTIATNPLAGVPSGVAVFGDRAYYAVGNATEASDVLFPLQRTNANQVLTFGDTNPITALAGLPLNNVNGGIIQSLMVFKGVSNIWQVTGDYSGTPSAWDTNTLNVATGTLAPRTLVPTPAGLAFVAPDGLRIIDFNANVGDPIGAFGDGVCVPFQQAVAPSRMAAAYNVETLRIAVRQSAVTSGATVEFWYNFSLKAWTGPHSLPTSFMAAYLNTFICAMNPTG
jgi:hypothetical protein